MMDSETVSESGSDSSTGLYHIDALNDAAWEVRSRDPGQAIQLCLEARYLAQAMGYLEGEASARSTLGLCYWIRSDLGEALKEATVARDLFERTADRLGLARTLNVIGLVAWHMGDFARALENYIASHRIYRAENHLLGMANQMANIAALRMAMGDSADALTAYEEAVRIMREAGNLQGLSDGLHNLGEVYVRMGAPGKARELFAQALELKRSIEDWSGVILSATGFGAALLALGFPAEAEKYVDEACKAALRLGFDEPPPLVRLARARVQAAGERADLPAAMALAKGAASELREIGETDHVCEAVLFLVDLCERKGHFAEATRMMRDLVEFQRSRYCEDSARKVRLLQVGFEVELSRATAEEERARREELDDVAEELRRLLEEKDAFMGTVSHDLQNPLNAILGFAEMLAEESLPSEQTSLVGDLKTAAKEMSFILGDLLRLNEIDVRPGSVEIETVDVRPVVEEIERRYRERARRKDIALTVTVGAAPTAPPCLGERRGVRRILDNLVSNAVKYTPLGGSVKIEVSREGSSLLISVEDSGPGIPEDEQERLFLPFERLSAKPTAGEGSVGLGLHIARRLAQSMGGDILCDSDPPRGATFTLFLQLPEASIVA